LTTLTRFAFRLALGALVTGTVFSQTAAREWVRPGYYKQLKPARLQNQVAQMLARDAENPPSSQGVIFAGSSTIARWDLKHYFAQYRTLNRGIDDSLVSDVAFYADRLIVPFKPSTIVLYAGDNDIAYGMTPDMVATDFGALVAKIHAALPKSEILILSLRPTIARATVWEAVKAANDKLAAMVAGDPKLRFVDLTDLLLTPDGKSARDLLADDLQHLNDDGFSLVSNVVKRAVQQSEGRYWRGYNGPPGQ